MGGVTDEEKRGRNKERRVVMPLRRDFMSRWAVTANAVTIRVCLSVFA